jgi:hypothetical protein
MVTIVRASGLTILGLTAVLFSHSCQASDGHVQVLDLAGHEVILPDPSAVVTAAIFVRSDCPISNRYAPEIQRLYDDYAGSGVKLYLVYPDGDETAATIQQHAADFALSVPSLRDPEHELVASVQATVTPSVAVFSRQELVYMGQIDDRYVALGQARPTASRHRLREVLDAASAGEVPAMQRTKAVGCLIADLQ